MTIKSVTSIHISTNNFGTKKLNATSNTSPGWGWGQVTGWGQCFVFLWHCHFGDMKTACPLKPSPVTIRGSLTKQLRKKTEGNQLSQVHLESISVLRPLYRTICVSQHPQLRTGGFCRSEVLLPACPCWWQLVHLNKTLEFSSSVLPAPSLYQGHLENNH